MAAIRIEISVKVKKRPDLPVTANFLREAVAYWVETGNTWSGVKIAYVTWQHIGKPKNRARGADELEEVRERMLSRFHHSLNWKVTQVGGGVARGKP